MTPVQQIVPTEDESVQILTKRLERNLPFFYLRYGDGALECMAGRTGGTCDGEQYSPELGKAVKDAWQLALKLPNLYLGDWRTAYFDHHYTGLYPEQYSALLAESNRELNLLHFEALHLRASPMLLDFYRAIKASSKRKLYMGPAANMGAADMLGADHLLTPMRGLNIDAHTTALIGSHAEIVMFGAGMAGMVAAIRCADKFPDHTYIHIGAALDPLFRGPSRSRHMTTAQARALFLGLLGGQNART